MAEIPQSRSAPPRSRSRSGSVAATAWLGWVLFTGIMLLNAGLLNAIQGVVALVDDDFTVVAASELPVEVNYAVWGWALLVLGLGLVAAGLGVVLGYAWARTVGVVVASINALVNLGFVAASPFRSVIAVAFDILIIYGLVVHGGAAKALRTGPPLEVSPAEDDAQRAAPAQAESEPAKEERDGPDHAGAVPR